MFHSFNLHFPYQGKPVLVSEAKSSLILPLPHPHLVEAGGSVGTGNEPRWWGSSDPRLRTDCLLKGQAWMSIRTEGWIPKVQVKELPRKVPEEGQSQNSGIREVDKNKTHWRERAQVISWEQGQLFAAGSWKESKIGLGLLNWKEKRVISTKAPITQPATIMPLTIIRLHCKPWEP